MSNRPHPKILIMTAVEAEQEAVLRGLGGYERADVQLAGVGPASAAAATATALARAGQTEGGAYSLVVSAGIGGDDFARDHKRSDAGDLGESAADLGAETQDGFAGVDELGFGSPRIVVADELAARWTAALREAGLPVHYGPILTLSTVTGTAETARSLTERYPGAGAEAMEGFGVAEAARQLGVPVLELRAISNAVGPRQRELWKIGDALQALEQACAKLPEVLQS